MHGAKAGAPKGKANGAWQHGMATNDMIEERRMLAELMRETAALTKNLGGGQTP